MCMWNVTINLKDRFVLLCYWWGFLIYVFSFLYWTELGTSDGGHPGRVARAKTDGSLFKQFQLPEHLTPNGLWVDERQEEVWLVDTDTSIMFRCDLNGEQNTRQNKMNLYQYWYL